MRAKVSQKGAMAPSILHPGGGGSSVTEQWKKHRVDDRKRRRQWRKRKLATVIRGSQISPLLASKIEHRRIVDVFRCQTLNWSCFRVEVICDFLTIPLCCQKLCSSIKVSRMTRNAANCIAIENATSQIFFSVNI